MAYVTPIGSNPEQIDYRLGGGHGCRDVEHDRQFSYHADGRERPLRWIGAGLAAVGIEAGSELTRDQFDRARALIGGAHPITGEQLVEHKLAVPDDAKVCLSPLVAAVRQTAQRRGVDPSVLFTSDRSRRAYARAERQVSRRGEGASLRADEAGALADQAGLDPVMVWGPGVYQEAVENLWTTATRTDERGVVSEVVVPRRVTVGNLGYDISFTLPKSHSLLLAFADEATAHQIEETYTQGVGDTFDWLEKQTAYGMRGHHGDGKSAETVAGQGFLGWTMVHRSARPVAGKIVGDPHWHVHATIANMTLGEDGKWSTVAAGGRDLMRHAPTVDHVLKALVRHQLTTTYGVEFTRSERTGAWEVAAIPDEVLRQFSKRGAGIEALLRDLGFDPEQASAQAERIAAAHTRAAKTDLTTAPDATLRELWQNEARAAGHNPARLAKNALNSARRGASGQGAGVSLDDLAAVLCDPVTGLTAHSRRFTRVEAIAAVADAIPGGAATVEEIEQLTDEVLARPEFIDLTSAARGAAVQATIGKDGTRLEASHMRNSARMTTRDVVAAEQSILAKITADRAAVEAGETRHAVRPETVRMAQSATEVAQGFELGQEQARALMALTTSGRQYDAIIGGPGAGKTTLMRAARAVWEAEGMRVAGAASAAVAAHNLQIESGIASKTVAQWLLAIEDGEGLAGVDVLVVDEANLTDDRSRHILWAAAAQAGTKVVEIGDPRQLRGVGCGSMFGEVHRQVAGVELVENRRQVDLDERSILAAWREGQYADALTRWATKGRLIATETPDEATTALVATWLDQRAGAPDPHTEMRGLVMLAGTNELVDRINTAAQAVRASLGELGPVTTYQRPGKEPVQLAPGDHVMLRINDRHGDHHTGGPGLLNGYRGVIETIHPDGRLDVAWQQDDDHGHHTTHRATLDRGYVAAGGVELGYAMTTHKAEGLTVKADWHTPAGHRQQGTVLVHAQGADNAGLYVAMSRHKGQAYLFAAHDPGLNKTPAPADPQGRTAAVVDQLAQRAETTSTNINDTPVAEDQGQLPAPPTERETPPEPEPRTPRGPRRLTRAERLQQAREETSRGRGDRGRGIDR